MDLNELQNQLKETGLTDIVVGEVDCCSEYDLCASYDRKTKCSKEEMVQGEYFPTLYV